MLYVYLTVYLVVGLVTAITTMRIFPPMGGFKPSIRIRLCAVSVFTILWPVLISLAVWYAMMWYLSRTREKIVETEAHEFAAAETLTRWQSSKPR